jgi:hypothetical protein
VIGNTARQPRNTRLWQASKSCLPHADQADIKRIAGLNRNEFVREVRSVRFVFYRSFVLLYLQVFIFQDNRK